MEPSTLNFTLCPTDSGLQDGFLILERVLFFVGFPINLIGLWCVIRDKTTRIKWILFNCQLWFFLSDILISILAVPMFLLSFAGYYSLGFLTFLGVPMIVQFDLYFTSLGVTAASILHLFFNRHQTIIPKNHKLCLRPIFRLFFMALVYLSFGSVAFLINIFIVSDNMKALQENILKYFCFYPELFYKDTLILQFDMFLPVALYFLIMSSIWMILIVFLVTDSFRSLHKENRSLSLTTRAQVRRSLRSIVLQISCSMIFMVSPVGIMCYLLSFKVYNRIACYLAVSIGSLHASMGTIAGLLTNQQYRHRIKGMFQRKSSISATQLWAGSASKTQLVSQ